jgi:hypothetical protein
MLNFRRAAAHPPRIVKVSRAESLPPTPNPPDSPQKTKHWWREWQIWKRILYTLTFLAVAVYAAITGYMWRGINRTNTLAEQSLRLQNAPWIKITGAELVGQNLTNGGLELQVGYTVKNYGNSPGVRLFSNSRIHTRETMNDWNHSGLCGQHYKVWSEKDYPFALAVFPSDVVALPVDSIKSGEKSTRNSPELWLAVCVGYLDISRSIIFNTKSLYIAKAKEGQKIILPIDHFELVATEPYEQCERPTK